MTEKHEVVLEPRAYGQDCTPAEREAIIARVSLFSQDIVFLKELPLMSEFSVNIMFDEIERLTKSLSAFYTLVDLSASERPPASIRQVIRERSLRLKNQKYVALFTGKNFLINMAANFVFGTTTFSSFSVHKTQAEALMAIQKMKNAAVA